MYCEIPDITKDLDESILIDLINDENRETSEIDLTNSEDVATARAIEQIVAADTEIDTYLRARYSLPLSSTPDRLKQISKDITIYNLYKRRHTLDMPESIVELYKMRIKELRDIQKGIVDLGVENEPQLQSDEVKTNKDSDDKLFTDDVLDNY